MSLDQIGMWAGFALTLMVFSYVLADNFLYRLAVYTLVGLAAGFIAIVTTESVLLPWYRETVASGEVGLFAVGMIPLILGLLLLFKTSARIGGLGNLAIAFIVGVGAAVALVGAITGTLIPLATTTAASPPTVNGMITVLGVVSSLVYFQYLARRAPDGRILRNRPVSALSLVGQGFIVVTLGALYAAAILTSLTIFSERVGFVLTRLGGG
jgi:hypothetical protein